MINAYWEHLDFRVQEGEAADWMRIVDTAESTPLDVLGPGNDNLFGSLIYKVRGGSGCGARLAFEQEH
jgi:hypothetical protein